MSEKFAYKEIIKKGIKQEPLEVLSDGWDCSRNSCGFVEREVSTNRRYMRTYSRKARAYDHGRIPTVQFESIIEVEDGTGQPSLSNVECKKESHDSEPDANNNLTPEKKPIVSLSGKSCEEDVNGVHFQSIIEVEEEPCQVRTSIRPYRTRRATVARSVTLKRLQKTGLSCVLCKLNFENKNQMRTHQKQHYGDRAFKCGICKRTFSHQGYLKAHIRKHKTKDQNVQCQLCSKKFKTVSCLKVHCSYHFKRQTKCPTCRSKFGCEEELQKHKALNRCIKPYECKWCARVFARQCSMLQHQESCILSSGQETLKKVIVEGLQDRPAIQVSRTYSRKNNYQVPRTSADSSSSSPVAVPSSAVRQPA